MHATINMLDPDHTCGQCAQIVVTCPRTSQWAGQGPVEGGARNQGPGMEMLIALSPPLVDTGNPI